MSTTGHGAEGVKLETTAEERERWMTANSEPASLPNFDVGWTVKAGRLCALLRDIVTILADNARLKAELAEAQSERDQFIEKWEAAGSAAARRQVEIDRLKAELADAQGRIMEFEAITEASPAVQRAMGHFYDKKAELEATAHETTARSSELRFLSTFSPILDKRVQTEGQLFGWLAACEAWRAAIAARRAS